MLNASKHEARPKISSPNPLRRIRRAVEDYDFDRLEVEAQQCVELTSTNRPFGLIIKLTQTVNRSHSERLGEFTCKIRSTFGKSRTCNASQISVIARCAHRKTFCCRRAGYAVRAL